MGMGFQFEQHRLRLWDLSWDLKKTITWEMGIGPPLYDPLRWTPGGKRKRGRPKTTWRKTAETELSEMGLSWGEAQATAKHKTRWKRGIAVAPCPTGGIKD